MAALAINIGTARDHHEMARTTNETALILQAIGKVQENVAGLRADVNNVSAGLTILSNKVDKIEGEKAGRGELAAAELRFDRGVGDLKAEMAKEVTRMERDVQQDVDGFQQMYESLIDEIRGLNSKMDTIITSQAAQDAKINEHDLRIIKIEPLRDTYMQLLGAKWVIGVVSAIGGSGLTLAIIKIFFGK